MLHRVNVLVSHHRQELLWRSPARDPLQSIFQVLINKATEDRGRGQVAKCPQLTLTELISYSDGLKHKQNMDMLVQSNKLTF